jgi:molybdopterin synthase catalytic subunit
MVQRLGTLEPGAVTTVIGCSSGHRDEGIFEAARYGIDRMKEIVPVWKKEIGTNGSEWVEGKYKPGPGE